MASFPSRRVSNIGPRITYCRRRKTTWSVRSSIGLAGVTVSGLALFRDTCTPRRAAQQRRHPEFKADDSETFKNFENPPVSTYCTSSPAISSAWATTARKALMAGAGAWCPAG